MKTVPLMYKDKNAAEAQWVHRSHTKFVFKLKDLSNNHIYFFLTDNPVPLRF